MKIIISKQEIENPQEFSELSIALVGSVHGNITYKEGATIEVEGLDAMEAGIALKIIKPYLA